MEIAHAHLNVLWYAYVCYFNKDYPNERTCSKVDEQV